MCVDVLAFPGRNRVEEPCVGRSQQGASEETSLINIDRSDLC